MFSQTLAVLCRVALEDLAKNCTGLRFASICTKDGFELVRLGSSLSSGTLSVMAGTMHALGDGIVAEAGLRECKNVIIEAQEGKAVILLVQSQPQPLVLMGVADNSTNLGFLLHCCKNCCNEIASRTTVGLTP